MMMRVKYLDLTPDVVAKQLLTDEVIEQCSSCLEYQNGKCCFHQREMTIEEANRTYCGGWYDREE